MNEISIAITMDCEPTLETTHSTATGPKDFAMSERAITGYFEIASTYGYPVTYFVHPETIRVQADLFKELASRGACIGLHMHPWKYSQWRYQSTRYREHFGQLSYAEQVALLAEAAALWRDAMGEQPLYFRPGTFSANDATFRALLDTGFRGGSISAPGRVYREIRSVWTGTEPDPHRTNPEFRMAVGQMPLGNMPLSADFSRLLDMGSGRYLHPDFRPDIDWMTRFGIDYKTISDNILAQVLERKPAIPVLNSISHNHYNYSDRADPQCQRYLVMLENMTAACDRRGLKAVGTTVGAIVERVLETDPVDEEFCFF
ncbi:MAG: polysaccharide deacetylase family protein [Nitratireductor sp.]|nr:polysaccharide deacetylase family protein [Nitratireductor sp.]